ncbi:MAG: ribosome silencing factor [Gammaproteobacteria bacterium]|nr:ribosome silencing factor [Gammaproteobacteria bacterium]
MQLEEMQKLVIDTLEDLKAVNIVVLDVSKQTSVTDRMIIASGTSSRHVKGLAENVIAEAKKAGYPALGSEGEVDAEWVLVDLGDVLVHVMRPETRELYDLEKLWTFVSRND